MTALLTLFLLLCGPCQASWRDIPSTDFPLPAPPAADSDATRQELDALLRLQESRSPEDCALAQRQKSPDFKSFFGDYRVISREEFAAAAPLLDAVNALAVRVSSWAKDQFMRPRPYDEDSRIKPCVPKPGGSKAYPSSHAAAAALDACVLARLFPERAPALTGYGRKLGDLRAVVGVHHPSDVAAGQAQAAQVCARLLKEGDFLSELQAVRGSLGTEPAPAAR